ncbi:MAG: hypothetical protein NVS3B18_10490 [Candidatus Dormibacteria bacterium]
MMQRRFGLIRWGSCALTASATSHLFARLVEDGALTTGWREGDVLGVEHEYAVMLHGRAVDFRGLVHGLGLGWPNLDPGDPDSYRLGSGAAVTADEAEAEIALAPMACSAGFATRVAALARAESQALAERLPAGASLVGYSTHLSVSVSRSRAEAVAQLFATSFAPALMLLMDQPSSPGLLVRPRPGRLELGGEFVDGSRLTAVVLFAVGSVRAGLAAVRYGGARVGIPEPLSVALQPDDRRYGWFVDRSAFGTDLYQQGRSARLTTRSGATISAQDRLAAAWRVARHFVASDATSAELDAVDRLVCGDEPLPRADDSVAHGAAAAAPPTPGPYGAARDARRRPHFDLAPVMLTWDTAVFVAAHPDRSRLAFATVPGPLLGSFQALLDEGGLDDVIGDYLRLQSANRRLTGHAQVGHAGLYDQVDHRIRLLTPERAAKRPASVASRWLAGSDHRRRCWPSMRQVEGTHA